MVITQRKMNIPDKNDVKSSMNNFAALCSFFIMYLLIKDCPTEKSNILKIVF